MFVQICDFFIFLSRLYLRVFSLSSFSPCTLTSCLLMLFVLFHVSTICLDDLPPFLSQLNFYPYNFNRFVLFSLFYSVLLVAIDVPFMCV